MFKGKLNELVGHGEFNQIQFVINQLLAKTHIATLVMVIGSSNTGSVSPVGTVNVTPLVNMLDGFGNSIEHGVIYNLPYFRMQGGANAIILDPQAGDIGLAVFAESDHSVVKVTKAQGNPGSARRNDWADGMYFGGFLNQSPTQYIQFNAGGISVTSPTNITLTAPVIDIVGAVNQSGGTLSAATKITSPNVVASTDVTVAGLSLINHNHPGVTTGSGSTGNMAG